MSNNVQDIVASLDSIDAQCLNGDEDARFEIFEAAQRLVARLESPFERAWRLSWIDQNIHAICQTLIDVGLWESWRESGGNEATLEELWSMCKKTCDRALLRRMLRCLASDYLLEETGEDRYRPTPFSLAMGDTAGTVAQTILSGTHHCLDSAKNLPRFLARTNYKEPTDRTSTNYMDLTPECLDMFARCSTNAAYQASFIGFMEGFVKFKTDWTDVYDTRELLAGFDSTGNAPLLVDVGGAHGVDIMRLLAKCPPDVAPGRLILQDLPDVVAIAKVSDKIRTMAHDFFTEQPCQALGSRAYFMHAVLHDWDVNDSQEILKRIGRAMRRGYSKLLIYETVMPATKPLRYQAVVDISLMHLISAAERTETGWKTLLEGAGFKVLKIWTNKRAPESVIEAELA